MTAAIIIIVVIVSSLLYAYLKGRGAGRDEVEGDHLANHAEKIGDINERARELDKEIGKYEPMSDAEWDDYFSNPDGVRGKPGGKG